jgi:hypothetical protein
VLREAELFVQAEQVLLEVLGRIRDEDRDLVLPPLYAGGEPVPMGQVVEVQAADDAEVAALLGTPAADGPRGSAWQGDAACAAVTAVEDDGELATPDGPVPVRAYLQEQVMVRCFRAHDVAMGLGSRACPLPEDLSRGIWELTHDDAARWRARGLWGEPGVEPDHVSWRDRFLLAAGRDPHPWLD